MYLALFAVELIDC